MKEFQLTPAIKWLEDTYLSRRPFDDNVKRQMFSIMMDHGCLYIDPVTLGRWNNAEEDVPTDRCFWEERDREETHRFSRTTVEDWDNHLSRMQNWGDDEFDIILELASKSPVYNAIGK